MLRAYKNQLFLWRDVIAEQSKHFTGEELLDRCTTLLLEKDEFLGSFEELREGEKRRELQSIRNGIQIFWEFVSSKGCH